MTDAGPFHIDLDRRREIRWTRRAEARLQSLPRVRKAGGLYQLCALIWSALVDRDHPFDDPEDVATHLTTPDQVAAAGKALLAAQAAAEPTEKNGGSSAPSRSRSSS